MGAGENTVEGILLRVSNSKFRMSYCNCHKYFFLVRIVHEWNDLPQCVVEAGNLSRFKSALKSFLEIL